MRSARGLRGLYGDSRKEAGARYEQALAKLFYVSGWTLNELAKKEGKVKSRITQMLIFGRFIGFLESSTMVEESLNVPLGLTERRFRNFWDQTEGRHGAAVNERVRFREVLRLMQEDALAPQIHRSKDPHPI
jgi:hypothetical protein